MPIDRTTRSSSLLGLAPTARRKQVGKAARGESASSSSTDVGNKAQSLDHLRRRLGSLVAQVDLADEESVKQVREPVLKEVLLWEFGEDFRQDPGFISTLESLADMLETQPSYQQQFSDLLKHLKH